MRRGPAGDRVGKPAAFVIQSDNELADDKAVCECDDPRALLEACVDDKPGCQADVDRSHVTNDVPHLVRGCRDGDFFTDSGHDDLGWRP